MTIGILTFVAAMILLGLLIKGARKRAKATLKREERSPVDQWVEEALARELGKKVDDKHGLDAQGLLTALRGDPDPTAVTVIEEALKTVKLSYERLAEPGQFQVRAEMLFEDGTSATGSKRFTHADLPELIRDEFLRTGSAFVYRDWHVSWYGPDRGWAT
ncbi:MAG: hypothetical protein ABI193_06895 [Minicystis sp.]